MVAVMLTEKRCTRCDTVKPAAEMTRCRTKPGGLMGLCLACKNEDNRRRRTRQLAPEAALAREFLRRMARYAMH